MPIELLVIDPQRDFCERSGALYVPGAENDIARLSGMIGRLAPRLDAIHVTLDSHHLVDIAHPIFWTDGNGRHPAPFTIIAADDVRAGRWTTTRPDMRERAFGYVEALERNGRYPLCIWPPHCLIGSPGHAVAPGLFEALLAWERRFAVVDYVMKGSNIWTEHYSAIQADVPDPTDAGTQPNGTLISALRQADVVAIAGEAGSHCVANTVRDLADHFGDAAAISKMVLLTDAVSPVAGFEGLQADFVRELTGRGMRLSTTADFSADLGE